MKIKRIAHLTTAHPRDDVRIYYKEALSTVKYHETLLVLADDKGHETINGLTIHDIGSSKNRWKRMFLSIIKMYTTVLKLDCDIVHFHDPEMLLIAIPFKLKGIKVIYDVHENVHKQILTKKYIPSVCRRILSKSFYHLENTVCKKLDAIVCATPSIADRFVQFGSKVYTINNYPLLNELFADTDLTKPEGNELAYVGVITEERGIIQLIDAMGLLKGKYKLNLAGRFDGEHLYKQVSSMAGWEFVNFHGQVNRESIKSILNRSSAGIVNFLPAPNHMEAQPNKMFEYMSAGLPLVCSDFPLWRALIDSYECGVTINPLDPKSIAKQIDLLLSDTVRQEFYGSNGRRAIMEQFNWNIEEKKLHEVYKHLLASEKN